MDDEYQELYLLLLRMHGMYVWCIRIEITGIVDFELFAYFFGTVLILTY